MNSESGHYGKAGHYHEQQDRTHSRYLELMGDYKQLVRSHGSVDTESLLAVEIDCVECTMLDLPPLSEEIDGEGKPTGIWKPRAKGLLPPEHDRRPKPVCRSFKADFEVLPTNQWSKWIDGQDRVDMRKFVLPDMILDQDGVGSCASEGMSGCIQVNRMKAGQEHVKLNPWFAYHTVSGGSDRGSTLGDNVSFAQQYGVCSQAVYGREQGWRPTPSDAAYEDAKQYRLTELWNLDSWEEFGTACIYGLPVYFGYPGHAIWASKVLDTNRLEYCNSWGDWGDGGFGTLEKGRIQFGYGLYAFRVVTEADRN